MTQRGTFAKDHPKRAAMDRYLAWKDEIGYRANLAGAEPVDGDVRIRVRVVLNDPRKRKWDISNVLKAVEDGLNGIAYWDDKQIKRAEIEVWCAEITDDGEGTIISVVYEDLEGTNEW